MHGQIADILTIKNNMTTIPSYQTAHHIKASCLACTVWPQQTHDFATADGDIHIIHDCGSPKALNKAFCGK
jgi:hypothetical protein